MQEFYELEIVSKNNSLFVLEHIQIEVCDTVLWIVRLPLSVVEHWVLCLVYGFAATQAYLRHHSIASCSMVTRCFSKASMVSANCVYSGWFSSASSCWKYSSLRDSPLLQ